MCNAATAAAGVVELPAKGAAKPRWTKIHGRVVDVEKFRHPGGNILDLFLGMDATTAFESFHGHHKGAWKMLKALPEKAVDAADVPEQKEDHVAEMSRLMTVWRERGLFKPRPVASAAYGLCVILAICAAVASAPHAPVLAGIAMGTCWAQCGFLQHMGGHREWGRTWSFAFQHLFEGMLKGKAPLLQWPETTSPTLLFPRPTPSVRFAAEACRSPGEEIWTVHSRQLSTADARLATPSFGLTNLGTRFALLAHSPGGSAS